LGVGSGLQHKQVGFASGLQHKQVEGHVWRARHMCNLLLHNLYPATHKTFDCPEQGAGFGKCLQQIYKQVFIRLQQVFASSLHQVWNILCKKVCNRFEWVCFAKGLQRDFTTILQHTYMYIKFATCWNIFATSLLKNTTVESVSWRNIHSLAWVILLSIPRGCSRYHQPFCHRRYHFHV
jgi:hypothetical protein